MNNKSFTKIKSLYNKFDVELSKDYKEINVFSEKALEISIHIIEEIDNIFEGRENKKDISEDKKIEIISRLKGFHNIEGLEILSVDELLEKIIEKVEDILSFNIIKLGYDIFPAEKETVIKEGKDKDSKFEKEKKSVDKFGILIKILLEKKLNLDDIVVYEEVINKDRMRELPYKLIHLRVNGSNKTIVISDEIGQATFIYDGLINLELFNKFSKGDKIDGLLGYKVNYSKNYYDNLSDSIFSENKKSKITKSAINNSSRNINYKINGDRVDIDKINIDNKLIEKYGLNTLLLYRYQLEENQSKLETYANIYKMDGLWYLGDARGSVKWPKINGKKLINFPNATFNKENNLGNSEGKIIIKDQLIEVFKILGMSVLDNDQLIKEYKLKKYAPIYRKQLDGIEEELKNKLNIYKIDCKLFFGEAVGNMDIINISGVSLRSYPYSKFNKEYNIGDSKGTINSYNSLKDLFILLGIAVQEDEKKIKEFKLKRDIPLYRKELEGIEEKLKEKINIYKIDGKWFFRNAKGNNNWPEISGKSLVCFPSTRFNKDNNLGDNKGYLSNGSYLKELFNFLGLPILELDGERNMYMKQLEGIEKDLKEKANIYKIGGKWYFGDANGINFWPKINGKDMMNFPSASFNKENNLGNSKGCISNIGFLKKIFIFLGMKVQVDEKKIKDFKLKRDIPVYKKDLEGIEKELEEEANIYKIDGKFYFGEAKGSKNWPLVDGVYLTNFPNLLFNRENNLGTDEGRISSLDNLKELFIFLGMKVQENKIIIKEFKLKRDIPIYRKDLEGIEKELEEHSNIYKIEGKFYFGESKSYNYWPSIGGRELVYFPNTIFNKENHLGNDDGIITSSDKLRDLFVFLGFNIQTNENVIRKYKLKRDIPIYKKQLEGIEKDLKEKSNIYKIRGKWYFGDAKRSINWPRINGKELTSFPSASFNKDNHLGNTEGSISNIFYLKELFIFLGMRVEKDEEKIKAFKVKKSIPIYRKQLEGIEKDLKEKANIYKVEGKWYFGNAKGSIYWPKLDGKDIKSFPSTTFNKKNNLGDSNGLITSSTFLKNMFDFLGMNILKLIDEKELYKKMLELSEDELKDKSNIYIIGGKWYFGEAMGKKFWPRINGRYLGSFPNVKFNKENNLGNKDGLNINLKHLKKLFIFLGMEVID